MAIVTLTPEEAWLRHIKPAGRDQRWLEDSSEISDDLRLSKRELFGLILLAHVENHRSGSSNWKVGFDSNQREPNDGFISDGSKTTNAEHKIIPQFSQEDVLDGILSTYDDQERSGKDYGANRVLIIQPNKTSDYAIRVSELREQIAGQSAFEKVVVVVASAVKVEVGTIFMNVLEQYPGVDDALIKLDVDKGTAVVSFV